jgi:hypothetical protein
MQPGGKDRIEWRGGDEVEARDDASSFSRSYSWGRSLMSGDWGGEEVSGGRNEALFGCSGLEPRINS